MKSLVTLLMMCATPMAWAQSQLSNHPKLYTTLHPLLVDTITHGQVDGVMSGDIANSFNNQLTKTTNKLVQGTLNVKSVVVERLPQKDCAWISVVFTKPGVSTPIGVTDANLRTKMKYCKDGSPPGVAEAK
jgi:hypothetical protein